MKKDIVVVGAGFCGLAVTWNLLNTPPISESFNIHLFDSKGIGAGASGIAAGLLHPYAGAHAKLNWMGYEGFQSTKELLAIASEALKTPVYTSGKGILRLALSTEQEADYQKCAQLYPSEVDWLDSERCQQLAPGCASAPGLWIKHGLTIYASLYLKGLWQACLAKGAQFHQRAIQQLKELGFADKTVITLGAATRSIPELAHLPLKAVKGQVLELEWPSKLPPLPCSLNSQAYILMSENQNTCLAGTTYERGFEDIQAHPEAAYADIMPKACAILPALQQAKMLNCYAGLRSVSPNHLPFLHSLSSNCWVLTGMGSKGLLYHALMAQQLVKQMLNTK